MRSVSASPQSTAANRKNTNGAATPLSNPHGKIILRPASTTGAEATSNSNMSGLLRFLLLSATGEIVAVQVRCAADG